MKSNVIIRMGASKFEAVVRVNDTITVFDLRRMNRKDEHVFRRELVRAFRVSREGAAA